MAYLNEEEFSFEGLSFKNFGGEMKKHLHPGENRLILNLEEKRVFFFVFHSAERIDECFKENLSEANISFRSCDYENGTITILI